MSFYKFLLISISFYLFLASDAQAGLIVQRPLYIGLTNGLVGYWSFDDQDMSGERAYDKSGNGNTGLLTNGPVRKAGRIGQALNFDGSDDYVDVGNINPITTSDFTISYWIRMGALTGEPVVVGKRINGTQFWRAFFSSSKPFFDFYANSTKRIEVIGTTIPTINTWYHIVFVVDRDSASNTKVYVNGINDTSGTPTVDSGSFSMSMSTQNLLIGALDHEIGPPTYPDSQINGLLDDVRVYNRALSPDEIKRLYKIGATTKINVSNVNGQLSNGLVGYWSFDGPDMNATQARDASGNANHGTLTNGPVRQEGRIGQALNFDGVDDYVTTSDFYDVGNDASKRISISLWYFAPATASTREVLIQKGDNTSSANIDYSINRLSNQIAWGTGSSADLCAWETITEPTRGQWHHVVATLEASDTTAGAKQIFVDGVLNTSCTYATKATANNDFVKLGAHTTGTWLYKGFLDDVRIYNRALSPDEIKRLYNIGATLKLGSPKPLGLDKGLVGHWTFDDPDMAGERAYDKSGNSNTGLLTNGPVRKTGRIGQALEFDGGNDWIDAGVPSNMSNLPTLTVSTWVKLKSSGESNAGALIDKGGVSSAGWLWRFTTGNALTFIVNYNITNLRVTSNTNVFSFNEWHFVTVTWNGSSQTSGVQFYVDGQSVTTNANSNGTESRINDSARKLTIGNISDTSLTTDGLLDDVRIYNRVLSADEIKRLYKIGSTLKINVPRKDTLTEGLVGYWTFDDNNLAGERAYDLSGQGNTGLLTNGPVRKSGRIGQALNFDGVDDYVTVADDASLDFDVNDFTMLLWVRKNVAGTRKFLLNRRVDGNNFMELEWVVGNTLNFETWTAATQRVLINSATARSAGMWYHVAVVIDRDSAANTRIYVDGANDTSGTPTVSTADLTLAAPIDIGRWTGDGLYWDGLIDDVRIYNRALSQDEIRRLYNMGR